VTPDLDEQGYTSPRLEQDVFYLTPWARPGRPDARYQESNTSSRRAVYDPPTDDGTEQAGLDTFGGASE
jgi:hypothetical protein